MKNYTIQADVMSEGNRRKMSEVGVINQRYLIVLKGNEQKLEVNSNLERLRVPQEDAAEFQVVSRTSGIGSKRASISRPTASGVVRAKAWKTRRAGAGAWTLEVPHKTAHQKARRAFRLFAAGHAGADRQCSGHAK